jgi:hypothetical protein
MLVIAASRSRTFESLVAVARGLPFPKSFDSILGVSPSTATVASSPKLLDRVHWHLRVKHYSIRTEQAYVDWIRRYILFHRKRHPNEMSEKEITEFLTHLAGRKRASPHPLKTRLSARCCFFTSRCSSENSTSSRTFSASASRQKFLLFSHAPRHTRS